MICNGGSGKNNNNDSPVGAFIKYHRFASNPGSPPTNRLIIYTIGSIINENFKAFLKESKVIFCFKTNTI